jgi:hypothetical protein
VKANRVFTLEARRAAMYGKTNFAISYNSSQDGLTFPKTPFQKPIAEVEVGMYKWANISCQFR